MFKKFTKREKIILGGATIGLVIVALKLKNDVFKAGVHYNKLANRLCSGGIWEAVNITSAGFDLVQISKVSTKDLLMSK